MLLLLATVTASAQTTSNDITGKWMAEDGSARFEIYKSGNEYRGKITWLKNPKGSKATDQRNPDKSLRNRPILGLEILTGLKYHPSENTWNGGRLYSPENGVYADASVTRVDINTIKIQGRKYGVAKTKTWKRYED
ncbi:DUF2147 domain-containing protein [Arundinibacter roseus]|nr:DUF2147 domain-containing protein [Arundinibacter roseus]